MNKGQYKEKIKGINLNIKWHEEELTAWLRVKDEAETAQAEAEKPKLQHWDLTVDHTQKPYIIIADTNSNLQVAGPSFLCTVGVGSHHTKIGCLQDYIDDLKALAEMPSSCFVNINKLNYGIRAAVGSFTGSREVCIRIGDCSTDDDYHMKPYNIEDIVKFRRELGGVIANAKKKRLDSKE